MFHSEGRKVSVSQLMTQAKKNTFNLSLYSGSSQSFNGLDDAHYLSHSSIAMKTMIKETLIKDNISLEDSIIASEV